jgi:hypothetical protein
MKQDRFVELEKEKEKKEGGGREVKKLQKTKDRDVQEERNGGK